MRVDRPGPRALPGGEHRLGDAAAGQATVRCPDPQKHLPGTFERFRAAGTQPSGDRLTGIGGQREPLAAVTLAAHGELPGSPVDVVQAQRGDLAGTQPEPGHQGQHREVPPPGGGAAVAAGQQRGDLSGLQRLRQPGQPPAGNRRHRPGQRPGNLAGDVQIPQQRPQRGHRQLR